jgi:hypothetical protein
MSRFQALFAMRGAHVPQQSSPVKTASQSSVVAHVASSFGAFALVSGAVDASSGGTSRDGTGAAGVDVDGPPQPATTR